jgi:hypothetical protein
MSSLTVTGNASGTATFTIAAPGTSTNRTLTLPDETSTLSTQAYASNASNLSSGTVPTARLGTGTASSSTFLRGDQTWQTISTTPTTADVLAATAGAAVGAVGTYAFLVTSNSTSYAPGATLAGSSLRYAGAGYSDPGVDGGTIGTGGSTGTTVSGTWRCMGRSFYTAAGLVQQGMTLWLRIS